MVAGFGPPMTDPLVGEPAPDFSLLDDRGETVRLSALRGAPVVLFFYPEDDTPGCTTQACGYRDEHDGFARLGARVFGVSPDDVASHARFREKFSFPYRLLSDPGHAVAKSYGAFGEKTLYGRKVVGVIRSSVVIDERGHVVGAFRNVRTDGNARRMLAFLERVVRPGAP